jgi:hypothetical protein
MTRNVQFSVRSLRRPARGRITVRCNCKLYVGTTSKVTVGYKSFTFFECFCAFQSPDAGNTFDRSAGILEKIDAVSRPEEKEDPESQ